MVRVLSLVWTLVAALLITGLSFFYITNNSNHGYPFTFAKDITETSGLQGLLVNYWSAALDALIWWFLFSILWIILKNYILQVD